MLTKSGHSFKFAHSLDDACSCWMYVDIDYIRIIVSERHLLCIVSCIRYEGIGTVTATSRDHWDIKFKITTNRKHVKDLELYISKTRKWLWSRGSSFFL